MTGIIDEARTTGPLDGIRIADFSRVLAGPFATMMLADFGADVIKIEHPLGDDTRAWVPPVDLNGIGSYFASVNRNKRSVVCDLRTENGLAEARALALSADVVIENFRPGVMEQYGLDYASLTAERPELVYCSVTGFGRAGGAALPGYDLLVQAVGGLMSVTGSAAEEPSKVGVALVDVLTGQNAVVGILAALRSREQTGLGQRVEVNLLSSLLAGLVNQASSTLATGVAPQRLGNAHPSIAPYETFRTLDDPIAIAVGTDKQFSALVQVLDRPELARDHRFGCNADRLAHRAALKELLEARLATRPATEWTALLATARVPAGKVNSIAEALELATELGLAPIVPVTDSNRSRVSQQIANPISLSATPARYRRPPPLLGEHNGATFF
ncbi:MULTISPECIES: CaiB/BaiF CoA-transferase family protein [Cryobacterium]|uniref:CoA transferase n=1 Tax=Cryobacterium levicorallinum TaxID=995038 RepID=A0A1I2XR61_9MICO|nr:MULTISPECIES: CoA transferase [Cryobacterium]TFB84928.1 CoA transferase [Cryobacterium levicorallinum]TFD57935.1 CoA transferase [Cryobacterium sp. Hh38]GEP26120.1 putative L-carnitine dehydratase [Cryobacterium levicorallinum]SFH15559.1 Crotonobetainyl-CoA:carnitine CoA-transferase CaiB [Cryobacterium levicorallinum]